MTVPRCPPSLFLHGRVLALVGIGIGLILHSAAAASEADLRIIPALEETFQSNQRGWRDLANGTRWDSAIENGLLRWRNKDADGLQFTAITVPLTGTRPHEIALELRHLEGSRGRGAGLLWGGAADWKTHNLALLDADGRFTLLRRENSAETRVVSGDARPFLVPAAPVRLTLRILGARSVLFVNGVVVWSGETYPSAGTLLGVAVGGGSSVEIDNLTVRHLRAADAVFAERLATYEAALRKADQVFITPPSPLTLHSASLVSVDQLARWQNDAIAHQQAHRYREAETLYRQILQHQPEHSLTHSYLAWCLLNLGSIAEAQRHAGFAIDVDPLGLVQRSVALYAAAALGDEAGIQRQLDHLALYDPRGAELKGIPADFEILARHGLKDAVERLRPRLAAAIPAKFEGFVPVADAFNRAIAAAQRRELPALNSAASEALAAADRLPGEWQRVAGWVAHRLGIQFSDAGDLRGSRPYLERAFTDFRRADRTASAYLRIENVVALANVALGVPDSERAITLLTAELALAQALPPHANRLKADFLLLLCSALDGSAATSADIRKYAFQLGQLTGTGRDDWYHTLALLRRGSSYATSRVATDRGEMVKLLEQASAKALAHGFHDLASSAAGNLALAYWKNGDKARARDAYLAAAAREEQRRNFVQAETLLNNLGALQNGAGDHAESAKTLRRAIALTESARSTLPPEERVHFLTARASAYQFLVRALHHLGNSAELFEAQNALRARSLAETLNLGAPPPAVTLAQFQQQLAADEAAIFYSAIGPAQIVAHVITRTTTRSVLRDGREELVALKERYLDRLHARRSGYKPVTDVVYQGGQAYEAGDQRLHLTSGDFEDLVELYRQFIDAPPDTPADLRAELLTTLSGSLGRLLVDPVAPLLADKQKVILFPDQILYFLPFEALPAPGARHWVERVDVRYVQSAAVWSLLRNRHYPDAGRRSFLGMGGALYGSMAETAPPLADATRHVQLQIQAQRNVQTGASQREVYAALFGPKPMTYLQGSLIEVRALGQLFPGAEIFTGAEMSENRLKAMARDGSLAKFRIVHLATHGFAFPEVPEVSGLAMTIHARAEGGEDGYLTAPEIARLGMRADLAVLSACQTALGRIYNGEGVAGLTSSLLLGGANRALVSLWPVSDAGTMLFMRDLYEMTLHDGVSYDVAVNRVKRRFITGAHGARYQDVKIWAPFIHYGL